MGRCRVIEGLKFSRRGGGKVVPSLGNETTEGKMKVSGLCRVSVWNLKEEKRGFEVKGDG